MNRLYVSFLVIAVLVTGCATKPAVMWNVSNANPSQSYFSLRRPDGSITGVSGPDVHRFIEAKDRIARAAGFTGRIDTYLSEAPDPNAFSTTKDGVVIIGITLPMVNLIGSDNAAMGQLIGHELAHQTRHHGDTRKERESIRQGASSILGFALSLAGVPGGGTIANVGTQAISASYSRDEEREADTVGFGYAKAAGYDPQGAIRLYQLLEKAGSGTLLPFLSSHPTSPERIENMRKLVAASGP